MTEIQNHSNNIQIENCQKVGKLLGESSTRRAQGFSWLIWFFLAWNNLRWTRGRHLLSGTKCNWPCRTLPPSVPPRSVREVRSFEVSNARFRLYRQRTLHKVSFFRKFFDIVSRLSVSFSICMILENFSAPLRQNVVKNQDKLFFCINTQTFS